MFRDVMFVGDGDGVRKRSEPEGGFGGNIMRKTSCKGGGDGWLPVRMMAVAKRWSWLPDIDRGSVGAS